MSSEPSDVEKSLRRFAQSGDGASPATCILAADEIARLRADFLFYASHRVGCTKELWPITGGCTCGLDTARARIQGSG